MCSPNDMSTYRTAVDVHNKQPGGCRELEEGVEQTQPTGPTITARVFKLFAPPSPLIFHSL